MSTPAQTLTFTRAPAQRVGRQSSRPVDRAALLSFALFELAYVVAYWVGMSFTRSLALPFWFPDSVLLCALLVSRPKRWWWFVLGAAPVRFLLFVRPGTPLWFLAACCVNDSAKAVLAAWLLRGVSRPARWMDDLGGFARYLLVAVLLAPALSALAGAASRIPLGVPIGPPWRTWFMGNALTSLVLTPLLVALTDDRQLPRPKPLRLVGAAVLAVGLAVTGYLAFHGGLSDQDYPPYLIYLPVPFLLGAGVSFGLAGSSAALVLLTSLAMYGMIDGQGPFYQASLSASQLSIQLFLFVVSVPFMLLSVLIDQQRRMDRSLRESEQRFGSLVDAAPVMVWMSGPEGLCTFVNRPWRDFTGSTANQALGRGRETSIHPDDRRRCASDYEDAFEARRKFTLEYRLLREDGAWRWVLESGIPRYAPDDTFLGYIGSCVDITERKEGEERLRQVSAQLMRAQESERSRIGLELHDDLSQRAAALSISLSYLARKRDRNVAEFEELQHQAADLCNGIRHVSQQLRPAVLERLGLAAALRDLCRRASSEGQTVALTNDLCPALPPLPDDAAIALYRIAQEAVQNAVKHSGSARIEVTLQASDDAVGVSVKDSGQGFAVGALPPPGIGLPGMAERMRHTGGSLGIHSAPGEGTTVTASVPLSAPARAAV